MIFSMNKSFTLLTLTMVFGFAHIDNGFSQQSKLGADLEAYITEIEGKEYWYGVNIDSKQVGYFSDRVYRKNAGDKKYIVYEMTAVDAENDIDGGRKVIESTDSIFFDASSGLPTKCIYEKSDLGGDGRTTKVATRDGDKWIINETGKDQFVKKAPNKNLSLATFFSPYIRSRSVLKVGTTFAGAEFDCESLDFFKITLELLSTGKSTIRGAKIATNVFSYKFSDEVADIGGEGEAKILEDGRLLSLKMGRLSVSLQAKSLLVGAPLVGYQDALNPSIEKPIENYSRLASLTVELIGKGFEKGNNNSYRQKSIAEGSDSLVFELGETGGQVVIASETEIEKFVQPKQGLEQTERIFSSVLRELKINEKTDDEKLWALIAFVSVYLEDSYFSNSSDALEILNAKKGDCSEHSTLFVALARFAGLPARSVQGYIYNDDEADPGFAYHAWAEVVLNEIWVGVDPMWGQSRISPTHVKLDTLNDIFQVKKIRVIEKRYIDEIPKLELKAAEEAFGNEDYSTALTLFQKMSIKDDPVSNFYLGVMFELGLGVETNIPKAIHYYRLSAARGDVDAKSSLADIYEGNDDTPNEPTTSAFWREGAANGGSPKDALKLAHLYEDGVGVTKNSRLAYQWYKYAAEVAVEKLESE
jgi:hypothetical protein